MQKILITGVAGFIGFHLAKRLLQEENLIVIGIDNLNNYYSVKLKKENRFIKTYLYTHVRSVIATYELSVDPTYICVGR